MPVSAGLDRGPVNELLAAAREELRLGRPAAACVRIGTLIEAGSDNPEAFHVKGLVEAQRQAWSAAANFLRRAVAAMPSRTGWHRDLGCALSAQGDWKGAADAFSQVLVQSPEDHLALAAYGRAAVELNRSAEAIPFLRKALSIRESVGALQSLGQALAAGSHWEEAVESLQRAVTLDPARLHLHRALGIASFESGQLELARTCWQTILSRALQDSEAESALIRVRWALGERQWVLDAIEQKIKAGSASEPLHSFWLYAQMYGVQNPAERRRLCEEFARRVAPPQTRRFSPESYSGYGKTKLTIGYLTGEFTAGPPFYFLSSLLGHHDFGQFDVFLYHTRDKFDMGTAWYSRLAHWRDCRGLDDDAVRDRIDRDGIHILVDLSGFLPQNRLRIFAGRAAPVQAAYPNCPTTTGVAQIDYIFTDRWTCGPGQETQYTEAPVFLRSGYLVYSPSADAPDVTPLPALQNGFVTFGIFQRRAKMHPAFWDAAAEILHGCKRSRLLVQNYDATLDRPDSENYRSLIDEFARRGISEDRISLLGPRPHREALETMAESDIALDTFPYQGQTTTCECLWQGVPVVALAGETHVSRVGSALLQRAGLSRLVASTQSDYVRKAVRLARDLDALSVLRAEMRDRLRRSTLLDGPLLARHVEQAYRRMWQTWIRGQQPARRRQNVESGQRRT